MGSAYSSISNEAPARPSDDLIPKGPTHCQQPAAATDSDMYRPARMTDARQQNQQPAALSASSYPASIINEGGGRNRDLGGASSLLQQGVIMETTPITRSQRLTSNSLQSMSISSEGSLVSPNGTELLTFGSSSLPIRPILPGDENYFTSSTRAVKNVPICDLPPMDDGNTHKDMNAMKPNMQSPDGFCPLVAAPLSLLRPTTAMSLQSSTALPPPHCSSSSVVMTRSTFPPPQASSVASPTLGETSAGIHRRSTLGSPLVQKSSPLSSSHVVVGAVSVEPTWAPDTHMTIAGTNNSLPRRANPRPLSGACWNPTTRMSLRPCASLPAFPVTCQQQLHSTTTACRNTSTPDVPTNHQSKSNSLPPSPLHQNQHRRISVEIVALTASEASSQLTPTIAYFPLDTSNNTSPGSPPLTVTSMPPVANNCWIPSPSSTPDPPLVVSPPSSPRKTPPPAVEEPFNELLSSSLPQPRTDSPSPSPPPPLLISGGEDDTQSPIECQEHHDFFIETGEEIFEDNVPFHSTPSPAEDDESSCGSIELPPPTHRRAAAPVPATWPPSKAKSMPTRATVSLQTITHPPSGTSHLLVPSDDSVKWRRHSVPPINQRTSTVADHGTFQGCPLVGAPLGCNSRVTGETRSTDVTEWLMRALDTIKITKTADGIIPHGSSYSEATSFLIAEGFEDRNRMQNTVFQLLNVVMHLATESGMEIAIHALMDAVCEANDTEAGVRRAYIVFEFVVAFLGQGCNVFCNSVRPTSCYGRFFPQHEIGQQKLKLDGLSAHDEGLFVADGFMTYRDIFVKRLLKAVLALPRRLAAPPKSIHEVPANTVHVARLLSLFLATDPELVYGAMERNGAYFKLSLNLCNPGVLDFFLQLLGASHPATVPISIRLVSFLKSCDWFNFLVTPLAQSVYTHRCNFLLGDRSASTSYEKRRQVLPRRRRSASLSKRNTKESEDSGRHCARGRPQRRHSVTLSGCECRPMFHYGSSDRESWPWLPWLAPQEAGALGFEHVAEFLSRILDGSVKQHIDHVVWSVVPYRYPYLFPDLPAVSVPQTPVNLDVLTITELSPFPLRAQPHSISEILSHASDIDEEQKRQYLLELIAPQIIFLRECFVNNFALPKLMAAIASGRYEAAGTGLLAKLLSCCQSFPPCGLLANFGGVLAEQAKPQLVPFFRHVAEVMSPLWTPCRRIVSPASSFEKPRGELDDGDAGSSDCDSSSSTSTTTSTSSSLPDAPRGHFTCYDNGEECEPEDLSSLTSSDAPRLDEALLSAPSHAPEHQTLFERHSRRRRYVASKTRNTREGEPLPKITTHMHTTLYITKMLIELTPLEALATLPCTFWMSICTCFVHPGRRTNSIFFARASSMLQLAVYYGSSSFVKRLLIDCGLLRGLRLLVQFNAIKKHPDGLGGVADLIRKLVEVYNARKGFCHSQTGDGTHPHSIECQKECQDLLDALDASHSWRVLKDYVDALPRPQSLDASQILSLDEAKKLRHARKNAAKQKRSAQEVGWQVVVSSNPTSSCVAEGSMELQMDERFRGEDSANEHGGPNECEGDVFEVPLVEDDETPPSAAGLHDGIMETTSSGTSSSLYSTELFEVALKNAEKLESQKCCDFLCRDEDYSKMLTREIDVDEDEVVAEEYDENDSQQLSGDSTEAGRQCDRQSDDGGDVARSVNEAGGELSM